MTKKTSQLRMTPILGVILFFFLPGCKQSSTKRQALNEPLLKQAKHADIPSPIGFTTVSGNSEKSDKTVFCYQGSLGVAQSTEFYQHAMELTGWEIKNFSTKREGLLICTKPNKECAISIRPTKNKTNVRIVVDQAQKPQKLSQRKDLSPIDIINQKKIDI